VDARKLAELVRAGLLRALYHEENGRWTRRRVETGWDACPVSHRVCSYFDAVLQTMLRTHPAVGSLTALAFVLIIGRADRFQSGKQIASYLGLVPLEESSGDRRRLGHITKKGNSLLRFLLVEAAQVTVRSLPSPLITSIEDGPRMLDPNWRCEIWRDRVLVLSTPAKLDL
jgi:hypothetical protein